MRDPAARSCPPFGLRRIRLVDRRTRFALRMIGGLFDWRRGSLRRRLRGIRIGSKTKVHESWMQGECAECLESALHRMLSDHAARRLERPPSRPRAEAVRSARELPRPLEMDRTLPADFADAFLRLLDCLLEAARVCDLRPLLRVPEAAFVVFLRPDAARVPELAFREADF